MIRNTGYGVIAEKPRVGKLGKFFSVHLVGNTMRWIKKMNDIVYDGHDEVYQSPCKVWGRSHNARPLYVRKCGVCYRRDAAKRQTAGIVFTHRPKMRFFAPQGRLVAPNQVKLCFGVSLWRQMAPQQSAKFRTAFFGQFRTSLRKHSVANYASNWILFSLFVRGPGVLYNSLNMLQFCR